MLIQKLFATFSTYPSIRPSDYSGSVEKQKIIVSIPFVHGKRPFDRLRDRSIDRLRDRSIDKLRDRYIDKLRDRFETI